MPLLHEVKKKLQQKQFKLFLLHIKKEKKLADCIHSFSILHAFSILAAAPVVDFQWTSAADILSIARKAMFKLFTVDIPNFLHV